MSGVLHTLGHALRDAIPPSNKLMSAANHTAFEMADLLSVPHAWVPQSLLSVGALFALALVMLYACFPPAVRASFHIMVWLPWLVASLLLICYQLVMVIYTLARILIALVLFLAIKLISLVVDRVWSSLSRLWACSGNLSDISRATLLRRTAERARTFADWQAATAEHDAVEGRTECDRTLFDWQSLFEISRQLRDLRLQCPLADSRSSLADAELDERDSAEDALLLELLAAKKRDDRASVAEGATSSARSTLGSVFDSITQLARMAEPNDEFLEHLPAIGLGPDGISLTSMVGDSVRAAVATAIGQSGDQATATPAAAATATAKPPAASGVVATENATIAHFSATDRTRLVLRELMRVVQCTTAHSNFGNADDARLFADSVCHAAPRLVARFKAEVARAIHTIAAHSALTIAERIGFVRAVRRALGRTALCLSGGGALSMYHMGVVHCMLEQGCLPPIISGTSGGSIVAAFAAIHTDAELIQLITKDISNLHAPLRWFQPVLLQIVHFARHGLLMDQRRFADTCRAYFGEWTFEEAFRRTGRIVNICISPSGAGGRGVARTAVLLNHLTTPRVLVYSAVVASCALPGLMSPVELLAKASDGSIQAYLPNTKFVDGSLKADIPVARLAELFNATRFVVSQVNPHIVPFARSQFREGVLGRLEAHVHLDLRAQCRKLAKLNLIPFIFGEPFAGVLTQKYTGHVTIFPDMTLVDSLKAISHPSRADMVKYIGGGQRATWSHIPRLQSLQCIEAALEAAHQSLLGMNRALLNPNAVFANGRTNVALASGAHQAVLSLGPHNAVLLDDEDFFPMSRRVSAAATQNAALLSAPFSLDKPSACAHPRSAALNSAAAAKPSSHATASAPPTPAVASINELSLLKVVDLRARLRVAGLPASGTKDALVQRLHAALVASAAVATRSANAVASNSPPPKPPVLPCGSSSLQSPSSGSLPDVAVATATHAATPSKVQPPLISPPPIPQSPSAAASRAANSVSFLTLADGNRDRSAHAPSESDSSVLSQFAPATTAAPSASSLLICQCCLQRASYDQLIDLRTALLARRMELDAGGA